MIFYSNSKWDKLEVAKIMAPSKNIVTIQGGNNCVQIVSH